MKKLLVILSLLVFVGEAYSQKNFGADSVRVNKSLSVLEDVTGDTTLSVGAGKVGIGTSIPAADLHVKSITANEPELLLESTNAGPGTAFFKTYSNSASPLAGDRIGELIFSGNNSDVIEREYFQMEGFIDNPTATDEATRWQILVRIDGSQSTQMLFDGDIGASTEARMEFNTSNADVDHQIRYDGGVAWLMQGSDGSIIVGAPTGGGKGTGTINAQGVFDDNVLLTDFVFEKDYEMKSISETEEFYKKNKHLPTIDGRDAWDENGKPSVGQLVNQLWETIEVQQLYITELNNRLEILENRGN